MKADEIRLLYEYNEWANGRILAAAVGLPSELFRQPATHSHRDLRHTLAHTLDAEYGWRMLCQHETFADDIASDDFADMAALQAHWQSEMAAMRDYIWSLDDAGVAGFVRYTTSSGEPRARVLWHCLWHVVNHGTQHRAEAAALLTEHGRSPGDLDFTVFMSQRV